eukprot:TRINITY_DN6836_c0_g1_i1.p1 TRINITY_DN6836_c0_g1~~TRINITY_DN6836_c0_g1_i1.p1  ORF type:complete len:373 (-),score=57.41 TRINITY_DN6836_c0_g1_i1:158-1276(-)
MALAAWRAGLYCHVAPLSRKAEFPVCVCAVSEHLGRRSFRRFSGVAGWLKHSPLQGCSIATLQISSLKTANAQDAVTPADESTPACFFQAVLFQYFFLAAACWWLCFAFSVNQQVVHNRQLQGYSKYDHAFSWGLPGILTIAAIASDSIAYSQNARICFLKEEAGAQIGLFFFWLGLIGLVGTVLMCQLVWYAIAVQRSLAGQKHGGRKVSMKTVVFFVGYNLIIVYTFFFNISTLGLQDKINQVTISFFECAVDQSQNAQYLYYWPNGTLIGPDPSVVSTELAAAGLTLRDLTAVYSYATDCKLEAPIAFWAITLNTTLVTLVGLWVFLLFGLSRENVKLWRGVVNKALQLLRASWTARHTTSSQSQLGQL